MAIKGEKCEAGCGCGKHRRAKCGPGCTCGLHRMSPERLAWLRANAGNRRGVKQSKEHRQRISAALTGRPLSDEHRRKVAEVNADPVLLKRKAESRKALRKTPVTHRQVHKRLVTDRGSATNYTCVDCSEPADAWTHNWSAWEGVAQDIHGKRLTFSTNLNAYEPRCHECHNRLDRRPAPWDCAGTRRGAKLTEADVSHIRNSNLSTSALARELELDFGTVWRIRTGRSWKHLQQV